LLIGSFADKNLDSFSAAELRQFESLLACSDPDLYEAMTGKGDVSAHSFGPMLQHLKEFSQSRGR
jgi:succinate dehydrogenase flavin-adding protein (antitoxin of CptAB toxin-antitoxin module)